MTYSILLVELIKLRQTSSMNSIESFVYKLAMPVVLEVEHPTVHFDRRFFF